ncbi:RING-H2 finger protein ATL22-like isoform X2 [Rhodamnia argentea]|uniref:RING-H2 finger protein ATL22-like isoform X2 n=1 Tax=Rhodamnia argentea TaxID=178133 RepID=A0ABM3H7W4_9MYRT|nr:RING-H2 finger protein ATL22-like isoform X2 [Rhodamnia argentea]
MSRTAAQNCSVMACSSSSIPVRFPFRLEDRWQPESCGYPGFNLSCDDLGRTIMRLPYSGEFFVREINFPVQQIQLYDPGDCLPKRLLQLNLSDSPFSTTYYENFTFLDCPVNLTSRYSAIGCLSNSTRTVLASSDESFVKSMATVCSIIVSRPIPISWPIQYDQGPPDFLNQDLQLSWFTPDCIDCEMEGGVCGFASNSSQNIGCFRIPAKGRMRKGLLVFGIVCLTITLPAIFSSLGIGVFICCTDRRRSTDPAAVIPQPSIVAVGLDDSTIESFTKIVLGESLRLTGPNDNICPICLAEYRPKEILRCIPACGHCFHAECIDEWLKMSSKCPVCRNSASPVPPNDT